MFSMGPTAAAACSTVPGPPDQVLDPACEGEGELLQGSTSTMPDMAPTLASPGLCHTQCPFQLIWDLCFMQCLPQATWSRHHTQLASQSSQSRHHVWCSPGLARVSTMGTRSTMWGKGSMGLIWPPGPAPLCLSAYGPILCPSSGL